MNVSALIPYSLYLDRPSTTGAGFLPSTVSCDVRDIHYCVYHVVGKLLVAPDLSIDYSKRIPIVSFLMFPPNTPETLQQSLERIDQEVVKRNR